MARAAKHTAALKLEEARGHFQLAALHFGSPAHVLGQAHAWRGLAQLELDGGRPDEATFRIERARQTYQSVCELAGLFEGMEEFDLQGLEGIATCHVMEADLHLRLWDLRAAKASLDTAYPLYRKIGDRRSAADLWSATARLAERESRWFTASTAWKRVAQILFKHGDLAGQGHALVRLGVVYIDQAEVEKARATLEESWELSKGSDDTTLRGAVLAGKARLEERIGAFEAAWDTWLDAVDVFSREGHAVLEARARLAMANVAAIVRPDQVAEHLRIATHLFHEADRAVGLALVMLGIARHAVRLEAFDEALVAAESGRRILRDSGDPRPAWALLARIARMGGHERQALLYAEHRARVAGEVDEAALAVRDILTELAGESAADEMRSLSTDLVLEQAVNSSSTSAELLARRFGLRTSDLGSVRVANVVLEALENLSKNAAPEELLAQFELTWVAANGDPRRYRLADGITTVGRGVEVDIKLGWDASVSRAHCVFLRTGDHVHLRDLGSTRGTLLDGQRVDGEEVLSRTRHEITVGETDFTLMIAKGVRNRRHSVAMVPISEVLGPAATAG